MNPHQLTILIVVLSVFTMASTGSLVGGFGKEKEATPAVQEVANSVYSALLKKSEKLDLPAFHEYVAVSYKSQVVAGTNYIIKIKVGENDFIVIKVFRPLPYTGYPNELEGVVLYKGGEIGNWLF